MSSGPGWSGCSWPSLDSLATPCYQARSASVDLGSRGGGGHLGPWPWDWPERPPLGHRRPTGWVASCGDAEDSWSVVIRACRPLALFFQSL